MIYNLIAKIIARLLWLILWSLSLLPLRILYIFGDIFSWILSHILYYRSDVIDDNLDYSFPEKHSEELSIIKKKYYLYLGELLAEIIKSTSAGKNFYQNHLLIDEETLHIMRQLKHRNANILILTGHIGNWEWAAKALSIHSPEIPVIIMYRPLSSLIFDRLIHLIRTSKHIILMNEKKITLLKNVVKPTIVAMVPDQSPTGIRRIEWHQFLSQNTPFTSSPLRIAEILNAQSYYCNIIRLKRGLYKIHLSHITGGMGDYVQLLENNILQAPSTWLWSHKRWKINPMNNKK